MKQNWWCYLVFIWCWQVNAAEHELLATEIRAGLYPGLAAMQLSVAGEPTVTAYAPGYDHTSVFDIRSATKSITALMAGQILHKYQIPVTATIGELITAHVASSGHNQLRLEDLLTMRSGLACNDWQQASIGHEDLMYQQANWVAFWQQLPFSHQPGQQFSYCTGNVLGLGMVLQHRTGSDLAAWASAHLFAPLQIRSARWQRTPEGRIDSGGHLQLTLADLHKIGELVLAQGRWQQQQLVQADWIKAMLTPQSQPDDRAEHYGYLWWSRELSGVQVYYAHGNGGNFVFVVPELALVASFTGTNFNHKSQFVPMKLLAERLIPQFRKLQPNAASLAATGPVTPLPDQPPE